VAVSAHLHHWTCQAVKAHPGDFGALHQRLRLFIAETTINIDDQTTAHRGSVTRHVHSIPGTRATR
jgi:hypothetical protein